MLLGEITYGPVVMYKIIVIFLKRLLVVVSLLFKGLEW
jgi:hypothetical protein